MKALITALIALVVIVSVPFFWSLHKGARASESEEIRVTLPSGLDRLTLSRHVGDALSWDDSARIHFAATYRQMVWASLNSDIAAFLAEKYGWDDKTTEAFLTHSEKYGVPEFDFLSTVYAPGFYSLSKDTPVPLIAGELVDRIKREVGDHPRLFLLSTIDMDKADAVAKYVERSNDLLPDLVPLPPQDLMLTHSEGRDLILFSMTYYNQGRGPLELSADPETAGISEDIERDVFQRIYRPDGTHRERVSGTFLWHEGHLHYHFADFVTYRLDPVRVVEGADIPVPETQQKTSFCIRDISRVVIDLPEHEPDAVYQVCGKEKQGISVGWGDTYFFNYPDQNIDITDLPSGTYRLSFHVNPRDRFDEISKGNNLSSATLRIDKERGKIEVLEQFPVDTPKFEHVHP